MAVRRSVTAGHRGAWGTRPSRELGEMVVGGRVSFGALRPFEVRELVETGDGRAHVQMTLLPYDVKRPAGIRPPTVPPGRQPPSAQLFCDAVGPATPRWVGRAAGHRIGDAGTRGGGVPQP